MIEKTICFLDWVWVRKHKSGVLLGTSVRLVKPEGGLQGCFQFAEGGSPLGGPEVLEVNGTAPCAATSWTHHPEQITWPFLLLTNDNNNTFTEHLFWFRFWVMFFTWLNLLNHCNNSVKFLSTFYQMEKERLKEIKCDVFSRDSKGKRQNESLNLLNSWVCAPNHVLWLHLYNPLQHAFVKLSNMRSTRCPKSKLPILAQRSEDIQYGPQSSGKRLSHYHSPTFPRGPLGLRRLWIWI